MSTSSPTPGRFQHADTMMATELGDNEVLMMDTAAAYYFGLRDVAAAIWKLFSQPSSVDEVVHSLTKMYDVDETTCRTETETFVADMVERGMLHPVA